MHLKRPRSLRRDRDPLPSLFDRHPDALAGSRHPRGVREVPLEAIVGTARHPTQNTTDFLPLPGLRGRNWEARWQRILHATEDLAVLPPIDLLQVGTEYWVVDGHNRIAAARRVGGAAIDADVTELLLPGRHAEGHAGSISTAIIGSEEVRQAGEGRRTTRVGFRPEELPREELAINAELAEERELAEETAREARDAGNAGDAREDADR
jgi:hypothetical protein